jgi:hypothetical protein
MIVAWMLFSLFSGFALTAAAVACDRLASLSRRPRRFIWVASMIATACWPAVSLIRTADTSAIDIDNNAGSLVVGMHRLSSLVVSPSGWEIPARWSNGLLVAWALVSTVLLARLALAIWYIRGRQRVWRTTEVDGVRVRVAPDAGPAVVGLFPMALVLPEWVLGMDLPLRALVLRHEAEHRDSRDPFLLLLATLMTALIPWNVALWFQSRRLRLVIEIDCDARVLRAHPDQREYASLLLTIAQRRTDARQRLMPALSEPTSNLERRIAAMHATPTLSRFRAVCLVSAGALAFSGACALDAPESTGASNQSLSRSKGIVSVEPSVHSADPAASGFFEFQVDSPATLIESVSPRFPATKAPFGGEVWAQFVVDTTGHVEMPSFKALKSTGPEFTAAVKESLATWRASPAVIHGKKVRQVVQQGFLFANLSKLMERKSDSRLTGTLPPGM